MCESSVTRKLDGSVRGSGHRVSDGRRNVGRLDGLFYARLSVPILHNFLEPDIWSTGARPTSARSAFLVSLTRKNSTSGFARDRAATSLSAPASSAMPTCSYRCEGNVRLFEQVAA